MKWVLLFSDPWSLLLNESASNLAKSLIPKFPVQVKHLGQYPNMTDNTSLFLFFYSSCQHSIFSYK